MRSDPLWPVSMESGQLEGYGQGTGAYRLPLLAPDLVRVGSWADRELARALVAELRCAGITSVVLPSDRCIGVWDIEVPAEAAAVAATILAGGRGGGSR